MKPNFTSHQPRLLLISLGLIFVCLLSSYPTTTTTASRLLIPKTGDDIVVNIDDGIYLMNSELEKGQRDENLMGVEEDCGDQGDEEGRKLKKKNDFRGSSGLHLHPTPTPLNFLPLVKESPQPSSSSSEAPFHP